MSGRTQLEEFVALVRGREEDMKKAEKFLDMHEDKNGNLTADDERHYKFLRDQIDKQSAMIDILSGRLLDSEENKEMNRKIFSSSDFTVIDGAGGYLVPSEWDAEIVTRLAELNPMRQISRVIQTNSRHVIPVQTMPPTA